MIDYIKTFFIMSCFTAGLGFIAFFVGRFAWEAADRIIEELESIRVNYKMRESGLGK